MVEKFNFYDIYGYLLPGLALLALLWIPLGILAGEWPKQELSSALLLLVLAYLAGHLVQTFAVSLLPSKSTDAFGNARHPSDLMLDVSDKRFTPELKKRITELANTYLKVPLDSSEDIGSKLKQLRTQQEDVAQKKDEVEEQQVKLANLMKSQEGKTQEEIAALQERVNEARKALETAQTEEEKQRGEIATISNRRRDAFFQARSVLLKQKGPWYWEQFEGLYALMRGTCVASLLSMFYLGAWALALEGKAKHLGFLQDSTVLRCSVLVVCLSLLGLVVLSLPLRREPPIWKRWGLAVLLAIVFGLAGILAASTITPGTIEKKACAPSLLSVITCPSDAAASPEARKLVLEADSYPGLFALFVCLAAAIASRCYGAYKAFADSFAEHVWRDFANLEIKTSAVESKS